MTLPHSFAALFAALALTLAGNSAFAQRGGNAEILFLDQQRIVSESQAGQSIDAQLRSLTEQVAAELQPEQAAIDVESRSLQEQRATLSQEAFGQRYQALVARAQRHEQMKQLRQAELQQARTTAITELRAQFEPIAESIFQRRKGYVLLERQTVLSADPRGDITDDVIRQLDRAVTTIAVTKPDLAAQLAAAQAAQAAQQGAPAAQ